MQTRPWMIVLAALLGAGNLFAQAAQPAQPKKELVATTVEAAGPDYKVQGEYEGTAGAAKIGVQVIALGDGAFQAVALPGGLPGAGWDGKSRILMDGKTEGNKTVFAPAKGPKKYLAGPPAEFSASDKFPPVGQADWTAAIEDGKLTGKTDKGEAIAAQRVVRESPTMGAKAPAGAIVLFDGSNKDEFDRGRIDDKTKALNTDGNDIKTKRKFTNYTAHLEFLEPFRPAARGQGRGNSGFYQVDLYEVQILDTFGLMGKDNECGGVYTKIAPKLNMCLPPLQWQTYDAEFTSAVMKDGQKTKPATLTLKLNGVLIHDKAEIAGKTGGSRGDAEGTPGPLKLQGHGNPLQFRNFWVVEKP